MSNVNLGHAKFVALLWSLQCFVRVVLVALFFGLALAMFCSRCFGRVVFLAWRLQCFVLVVLVALFFGLALAMFCSRCFGRVVFWLGACSVLVTMFFLHLKC